MEKPITLVIKETKENIINKITESKLPAWLLFTILKDITTDIGNLATQQTQNDEQTYLNSLKETKEKEDK